jgi:hypothetical protein
LSGTFYIGINLIANYSPIYYQSIPIQFIPSSIIDINGSTFIDKAFKFSLDISDFDLINSNTKKLTDYTHYSSIQIDMGIYNKAYYCDFNILIPKEKQLVNGICSFSNSGIVTIYGYDRPISKNIIEFVIYANNITGNNFNISIY